MYIRPFEVQAPTVNLVVTASSQALSVNASPIGVRTVRLANIGTQTVFVAFGDSTVTTTVNAGFPLLPNSVETFLLHNEASYIAAIAASTGSTLYATVGEGA